MFWRWILFSLFLFVPFLRAATPEEIAQRQLVNQMQFSDKLFEELSHQQVSEWGEKALRIKKEKWKHVESDHFILHYQIKDVRDRVMKEAEFYYWKIKNDLKLANDLVNHKSHIFVFEDEARWQQFQANVDYLGVGGVTRGHEFFNYYPKKKDKMYSGTLAHEMTHLVFNRFFRGYPPLWLNEGFAECQAEKAFWAFYDKRYERQQVSFQAVSQINFMQMTYMQTYPEGPARPAFYTKSQLAVEVLLEKGGPERFVQFLNTIIQNHTFENAFEKHYQEIFHDLDQFLKELSKKEKHL